MWNEFNKNINQNKFSPKQLERSAGQIDIGKFVFLNEEEKQNHFKQFYSNTIDLGKFKSNPIDLTYWDNLINNVDKLSLDLKNLGLKYLDSMGTIGLGNHFVELLQFDKEISNDFVLKYNIDESYYYILVHSGSRGLGYY